MFMISIRLNVLLQMSAKKGLVSEKKKKQKYRDASFGNFKPTHARGYANTSVKL